MAVKNLFEEALAAEGVSGPLAEVARSIYTQESGRGKNTKTSNAGAVGGMQIIPATFASVADKGWDINDPNLNARAGIRYLKQLDKQSGGDPALTAAGYYGGPGGMEKARQGIAVSDPRNPNAPDTLQYGAQVAARLGKQAAPAPVVLAQAAPIEPTTVPVAPLVQARAPAADVPQVYAPDAWVEWNNRMRQSQEPVQVADLNYGRQYAPQPQQVQAPDFMAALASLGQTRKVDFSGFAGFGTKARV